MIISNDIRKLGQAYGVDPEKEFRSAQASLLKKDQGQLNNILGNAHQSIYLQHTRGILSTGDDNDRKNGFVDTLWTLAAVAEANRRLVQAGQGPEIPSKSLGQLVAADIFPGDKKAPEAIIAPLSKVMSALGIPIGADRIDTPGLVGNFKRIVDKTELYEGQSWTSVRDYQGGMSAQEIAASKSALAKIKVTS
jgi:hypothetical protein